MIDRRLILLAFTTITLAMIVATTVLTMAGKSISDLLTVFVVSGGAWVAGNLQSAIQQVQHQVNGNTKAAQETIAAIATSAVQNAQAGEANKS